MPDLGKGTRLGALRGTAHACVCSHRQSLPGQPQEATDTGRLGPGSVQVSRASFLAFCWPREAPEGRCLPCTHWRKLSVDPLHLRDALQAGVAPQPFVPHTSHDGTYSQQLPIHFSTCWSRSHTGHIHPLRASVSRSASRRKQHADLSMQRAQEIMQVSRAARRGVGLCLRWLP